MPFSCFIVLFGVCLGGVIEVFAANPAGPDRVTFYSEPNFKGAALVVEAGARIDNLDTRPRAAGRPWTYGISSVRIEGNARAIVYTTAGYGGDRLEIRTSVADLYGIPRNSTPGATWDRCIASVVVTGLVAAPPPVMVAPSPAPSLHGHPRAPAHEGDSVIIFAFRDILGRDPSWYEMQHYREMWRRGWTQRMIRDDLRRIRAGWGPRMR